MEVFDEDSGYVGTLDSWTLRLIGSEIDNDDQYVYTDEFAEAVADQAARATLSDSGGIDTLNAAAVTAAMTIDLRPGTQSQIDGRTLTITSATTIENAVGGDGGDILRGQDTNNHLRGMRGDDTIEGGGGDDYLLGGSGNDTFDWDESSRSGVDTMEGGTGDDIYVINDGDQIIELPGEGTDAIWAATSYSLESLSNVENLFLFGVLSASATGNDRDNSISGNQSPNLLKGMSGSDTIRGSGGNDTIEGGVGNDYLLGGSGNDTFDWNESSRSGIDTMEGGTGNDIYVITDGDQIVELQGEGTDTIFAAASYSLEKLPNIENLILFGVVQAAANGNDGDNSIYGNTSSNLLRGMSGSDVIRGGAGNDTLDGGTGQDTASFTGPRKDYTVRWDITSSKLFVTSAAEGADELLNVETLAFSDASYAASAFQTPSAPTLSRVDTLTGATEDTAFTITWGQLAVAADEADAQDDAIGFRVEAVTSGTLTKGGAAVSPGTTVLREGESLVWTGSANAAGTVDAFTIKAVDDALASTTALQVRVQVANVDDSPTGSVSVNGTAQQGETLGAGNTLADADGIPTSDSGAIAYQWLADGQAIEGATGASLTLTQALVGKAVSVRASYTDNFGQAESATSAATPAVENVNESPTGTVSISGTAQQGQTLSASDSLADADGIPASGSGAIAYQWLADGQSIEGATGASLNLTQALVGKAVSVRASYTDNFGQAESATSAATPAVANVNDSPTGTVNISGTAQQGGTLSAGNTLADADGIPASGSGAIAYQWLADGQPIEGATGASLNLTQALVGKTVSVRASYTDNFGQAESASSAAAPAVANVNDSPTGAVSISGTAQQGQTLSAIHNLADEDGIPASGPGAIAYQWLADGQAIEGATGASLNLTQALVGKAVSVRASYTDGFGQIESLTSETTTAQPGLATLQLFAFHWKSHELLPNLALELRAPGEAAPLAASTDAQGSAAFAGLEPGPASLAAPTATPASGRAAADAAVNLQDAVAILRMVAGLDLNGPGRPLSPYQTLAADVDSSGGVSLADALAVLRHAVGLPAPAPAWHLLADTDPLPRLWAATAPEAAATVPLALQAGEPATQGLVAVLRGDVDGSHSLGPGAAKLEDLHPGHLADLHTRFGLPLSQFGVYGEG